MQRRSFLRQAATGAAATAAVAAPAIVSAQPTVRWRLASSYPKSLDTLFGASETLCKFVAGATGGKFQISAHAAGELVPALQVLDAVQLGTVECGSTLGSFYFGKDPTFAFDTTLPFGLNTRQMLAWMHDGGGMALMREMYAEYGVVNFPMANTGAQMGGWFRKEINSLEDLKGLKMRIAGVAGTIMGKYGLVAQQLGAADLYPALERGTIDAAEFAGPYDDERLGLYKVARNYYYPGWWEGCAQVSLLVNQKAYDALPAEYKSVLEAASAVAMTECIAKYDARNPAALKRLVAGGATLKSFPRPVLDACWTASQEWYADTAGKNPKFRKVYDAWSRFRADSVTWFRVTENTFDDYVASQLAGRR